MTTTNTSPAAIARIIKNELGMPTVSDHTREGVRVQKGARGEVTVTGQFEIVAKGNRRMKHIIEMLKSKGYQVRVTEDPEAGIFAYVSKGDRNAEEIAQLRRFAEETDGQIDDLAHRAAHLRALLEMVEHEMSELEAARATALQDAAYLERCDRQRAV